MLGTLLGPVIGGVTQIVDKLIPDKDLANKLKHEIQTQEHKWNKQMLGFYAKMNGGQLKINAIEASQGLFKGGWRPALGWIMVLALGYNYVLSPIIASVFVAFGIDPSTLPQLEMHELIGILMGMLGMSGMRGREKLQIYKQIDKSYKKDKADD